MENKGISKTVGIALLCAAILSACSTTGATTSGTESSSTAAAPAAAVQEGTTAASSGTAAAAAGTVLTTEVKYDTEDLDTEWSSDPGAKIQLNGASASVDGAGAAVKDSTITITAAGTYVVSGKLDDGQIVINVKDKGQVQLVLNGAQLHNSTTAPIFVEEGKTIITLADGTENVVTDGTKYVYPDAATDEPNSPIFSKDNLTINGTGKLVVEGNYNNGITSKDKLRITGGTIEVHAVDDAIMGRDLAAIKDGVLMIEAGGHGIKTTNDTAGSEGFISIAGGAFKIQSGEDALHSTGGIHITGGDFDIAAGDDGINADLSIAIAGGTIDITKSNEGIEAPAILISEGQTSVVSTDDGVNVAGGVDGSGGTGAAQGPGKAPSGSASTNKLTISGGYLTVNAQGDGLDANGSIAMTGGTVTVNGPTMSGNGSLDYDGTFEMTGGVLVAAGSSGMVQAASDKSTQYGILMIYPQVQSAGTLIHLEDSAGNDVVTFAPAKNYQAVYISSPDLKKDGSYILYSGGSSTGKLVNGLYDGGEYQDGTKVVEFKTVSIVTWLNESGVTEARAGGFGGGGGRGPGGGGGGRMAPGAGGEPPQRMEQMPQQ